MKVQWISCKIKMKIRNKKDKKQGTKDSRKHNQEITLIKINHRIRKNMENKRVEIKMIKKKKHTHKSEEINKKSAVW